MKNNIQAIILALIIIAIAFLFVWIGRESKPLKECNCRLLADTVISTIRRDRLGWISQYDTLVFVSKNIYYSPDRESKTCKCPENNH